MGRLHRARWGHTIQSYADDELNAVRATTVARHLAGCPDCSGDLEVVRRLKSSLARLADRRPPDIAVACPSGSTDEGDLRARISRDLGIA